MPATKSESFKPAAGTMETMGYDELGYVEGSFGGMVVVDLREIRDSKGGLG